MIKDVKTNQVCRYETCIPGQPNSHDEYTCDMCIQRRDEENRMESDIVDDEEQEYQEEDCNGVRDIVITGEVSFFLSLFVALRTVGLTVFF